MRRRAWNATISATKTTPFEYKMASTCSYGATVAMATSADVLLQGSRSMRNRPFIGLQRQASTPALPVHMFAGGECLK